MLKLTLKNTRHGALPGNGYGGFCIATIQPPSPGSYIMEIWKDIPGYVGNYQVSNMGNIKSLVRERVKVDRILKPWYNNEGYPMVKLCKNGICKSFKMQRFVAIAFIPNPDNKPATNHKNGIKSDIRAENLEWVTNKENTAHAIKIGLIKNTGENSHYAKLNEFQVRVMRKAKDLTARELSKIFNTHFSNVHLILKHKTWKHIK